MPIVMQMETIQVPLPKKLVRKYSKEARRRTRELGQYVSMAAVARDVLKENAPTASAPCQPMKSEKGR